LEKSIKFVDLAIANEEALFTKASISAPVKFLHLVASSSRSTELANRLFALRVLV
jgi:hypothetical protein